MFLIIVISGNKRFKWLRTVIIHSKEGSSRSNSWNIRSIGHKSDSWCRKCDDWATSTKLNVEIAIIITKYTHLWSTKVNFPSMLCLEINSEAAFGPMRSLQFGVLVTCNLPIPTRQQWPPLFSSVSWSIGPPKCTEKYVFRFKECHKNVFSELLSWSHLYSIFSASILISIKIQGMSKNTNIVTFTIKTSINYNSKAGLMVSLFINICLPV